MDERRLEQALDWSMTALGGTVEWEDCASDDPSEWAYADLEIFYGAGRCHHLALALHDERGWPIQVLYETDPDELESPDLSIPLHVFTIPEEGLAFDVRGRRSLDQVVDHFACTVGLMSPSVVTYRTREEFEAALMERRDAPLRSVDAADLDKARAMLLVRGETLGEEHREAERLLDERDRVNGPATGRGP